MGGRGWQRCGTLTSMSPQDGRRTADPAPAPDRLLVDDARTVELEDLPLDVDDVVDGHPVAGLRELTRVAGAEVGLWSLSEGTVRDVEADEVFVVLAGEATLTLRDGTRIELRPGSVVQLEEGDETTWEVRSTLRKVYVSPAE